MRVFEKKIAFFCFCLFYVAAKETEKWKRAPKPIKIVFLRWSSKNERHEKKWIFSKICLTLFVSRREKKRAFSCTLSALAQNFCGPKQWKPGKTIKSGFGRNCPKPKMTPFFEKGVFGTGEKWVLLTVFLRSCALLKTLFIVFSAKHSSCNKKAVCWKQQKIYAR